jgi:hypothetical protein
LYLKNEILDGATAAQICLNEEEMPNDLLPNNNRAGTVSPINGPAIYQGHGCERNSIILVVFILVSL